MVIKVSGHELDDAAFLRGLAEIIVALNTPVIVVHGGGKEISTLQQQMGIEPLPSLQVLELPMRFILSQRSGFAEQLKADLDRAYDELAEQDVELNVTEQ